MVKPFENIHKKVSGEEPFAESLLDEDLVELFDEIPEEDRSDVREHHFIDRETGRVRRLQITFRGKVLYDATDTHGISELLSRLKGYDALKEKVGEAMAELVQRKKLEDFDETTATEH